MAIDFYNNYITNSHDNPIEADGSMHNIRVLRNMFINHPSHAFCNQPALGGPVYWIRNIAYQPAGRFDAPDGRIGRRDLLQQHDPVGDTSGDPQNSALAKQSDARTELRPTIFSITTNTNYTSSDYNGFRPESGRRGLVPLEFAARPAC